MEIDIRARVGTRLISLGIEYTDFLLYSTRCCCYNLVYINIIIIGTLVYPPTYMYYTKIPKNHILCRCVCLFWNFLAQKYFPYLLRRTLRWYIFLSKVDLIVDFILLYINILENNSFFFAYILIELLKCELYMHYFQHANASLP